MGVIYKLSRCGVWGTTLRWLQAYLKDRPFKVFMEDTYSSERITRSGVLGIKRGGVGLIVKNALKWKLGKICVGNEHESEDILAMKCEKGQANDCIILVVCYMTTIGLLVQDKNRKKYTTLERKVQEFSRF
ncbi:hypothetical protein FHG87_009562 [Trinorchestia longiramus]|nr:hypothetical protein FHG87_009562 [Trinorchestia longiramus]